MAIAEAELRFLIECHKRGASFARTVTIGRQHLLMDNQTLRRYVMDIEIDYNVPSGTIHGVYADELFRYFGAEKVDSLDASSYEGATILHDMNKQIPPELKQRYSVVLDGGSLEHIFNFPMAIKNCMEMIEVGGHFIGISPANNLLGHGFYQFSPDLYFSIFTKRNGFVVKEILFCESMFGSYFVEVSNPATSGQRIQLRNNREVYMYVLAARKKDCPVFLEMPQQSFYQTAWQKPNHKPVLHDREINVRVPLAALRKIIPARLKNLFLATKDFVKPPLDRGRFFSKRGDL
jgi:hypothetical protein